MLALAQCWNLLAGYAGLVSVGQQAFVGLGGYLLFALTIGVGVDPIARDNGAVGRRSPPPSQCRPRFVVFRLRGAYFAIGSWVVAEVYRLVFAQFKQLGGGTGTSLPPSVTNEIFGHRMGQGDLRRACAGGARHHHLLDRAGARRPQRRSWSIWCCDHATAWPCSRSAIPRPPPKARRRQLPDQARRLCPGGRGDRHDRRADLPAEGADLAGCRVLRAGLDAPTSSSSS